jgi:hypothetical protein
MKVITSAFYSRLERADVIKLGGNEMAQDVICKADAMCSHPMPSWQ